MFSDMRFSSRAKSWSAITAGFFSGYLFGTVQIDPTLLLLSSAAISGHATAGGRYESSALASGLGSRRSVGLCYVSDRMGDE